MNRHRYHLFAGARFAFDQHRRVRLGQIANQFEHSMHSRILAQDVVERISAIDLLAQTGDLVLQDPVSQRSIDDQTQMLHVDRLGQKIISAKTHRMHRFVDAPITGHDNDGYGDFLLLNLFNQLHAVQAGHLQVSEKDAVVVLGERFDRLLAVRGGFHLNLVIAFQQFFERLTRALTILSQ